jgi:hypothetical protein
MPQTPRLPLERAPLAALLLAVLAGCASTPPAVAPEAPTKPPEPPPQTPAPPPDLDACKALAAPLSDLIELSSLHMLLGARDQLRYPDLLATKLREDAGLARALRSADPEMARIAVGTADLLDGLGSKAHALAEAGAEGRGAALAALFETAEAGGAVTRALVDRCGPKKSADKPRSGRLAPELIQKIVRAKSDVFQACYEHALRNDSTLRGRVSVSFVIARDGSVSEANDADRSPPTAFAWGLPEALRGPLLPEAVSRCVVAGFLTLSFPPPEGGIVTVGYPLVFSPAP